MTKTIAVAGKGGTGKTTVAALLIRYLVDNRKGSVLAIDADPSTNLNLALGVPLEETVGDIREETLQEVQGGLIAAARVAELIKELHTHAGQVRLVVNRVMSSNGDEPQLAPPLQQIIADNNLQLLGLIPQDPTVAEFDALGKPLAEMPPDAPVRKRVEEIITSIDGLL